MFLGLWGMIDDLTVICFVLIAVMLVCVILSLIGIADFVNWIKERKQRK